MFFSRLFYVVQHFSDFGFDVMRFILINGYPGLSLFGALFGGFLFLFLFCKSRKISFMHLADYLIGPVFLALAVAKIGSFFGGIDIGQKTNFIIATKYLGVDGLRHPIALYESLFFVFGVYFSFKILMSIRKNLLSEGFSFYFFIFYFSLTNLLLDKLKVHQLYFFGASFNLWVAGALVIIFGIYFLVIFRKNLIHYGRQALQIFSKRTKGKTSEG
jgi:phosphatidylglycerol:prolipoprotein diacylglycerol transferase